MRNTKEWINSHDITDAQNDWDFHFNDISKEDSGKGGLILKDLFHDGYSFATDIRTLGIWLFPKDTDTYDPVFLVLGEPDFNLISSNIPNKQLSPPPFNFSRFQSTVQLDACYESKAHFFGTEEPISIKQKYIFTEYSSSPAHEPMGAMLSFTSASLPATRLFPLVTLELPNAYKGLVASFRVDYYLHPKLEGFVNQSQNQQHSSRYPNGLFDFPNQAGIFLDGVNPLTDLIQVAGELLYYGKDEPGIHLTNSLQGVFKALEKPCVLELCVTAMKNSALKFPSESTDPDENGKEQYHWDNIHWWGSRGVGNNIISALGAAHAFHLHWRWGYGASTAFMSPQFQGQTYMSKGPLVDPRLPHQTVRLALIEYDENKDPAIINHKDLSTENFADLFINEGLPKEINTLDENNMEGANITLWYSVECEIPDNFKAGTAFIHGIFFMHEEEPNFNPTTGSQSSAHWPKTPEEIRDEQKWYRATDDSNWTIY